jgi:hypothetical protein
MNKKQIIPIVLLVALSFAVPLICATSMTGPVDNGNYTKSLAIALTVTGNGANNMTNITCYYNATGGPTGTFMIQILNTTPQQTSWTGTATLTTEALKLYNVSCQVRNGTTLNSTFYAKNITIDGTNPVTSLTLESVSLPVTSSNTISWTATDATAGLKTVVTTVTSPDTGACPTKTYTDTNGRYALVDESTRCDGDYTVLVTATDYSGNIGTSTKTFNAYLAGLTAGGSSTLGGNQQSQFSGGSEINSPKQSNLPLGETGTNVAIVLLLVIAIWYFLKK